MQPEYIRKKLIQKYSAEGLPFPVEMATWVLQKQKEMEKELQQKEDESE